MIGSTRAVTEALVATALPTACPQPPTEPRALLVTPPTASVGVGDAIRLTAIPDDDRAPAPPGPVTGESRDTSAAPRATRGSVPGVGPGSATITATVAERRGSPIIIVKPPLLPG